jgi:hypothetical protein
VNEIHRTIDHDADGEFTLNIFWGSWIRGSRFNYKVISLTEEETVEESTFETKEDYFSQINWFLRAGQYQIIISEVTNIEIHWIELQSGNCLVSPEKFQFLEQLKIFE